MASRTSGRGGGTTLPGRALIRMAPDALSRFQARLAGGTTLISATNGKTTTAGMIAGILKTVGRIPVHNRAGSNMSWGVATALLDQDGDEGLFEVDEAWLPKIAEALSPSRIILGNLFRDQLDRYGELETIASRWASMVADHAGQTSFILNADDPMIADLGRDESGARRSGITHFGIDDPSQALPEAAHARDVKNCRRCGHVYDYERAFIGHLGHYSCPNCGARRPDPEVSATRIELRGMAGSEVEVKTPQGSATIALPLPGLYNVYNALGALAVALESGISLDHAVKGLADTRAVFGRVETIEVADRPVSIMLIKNPTGANEVLRTILLEKQIGGDEEQIDLWIALNDGIADGRDISWVWDADFEPLAGAVRRVVCAGTRAPEMALRLKYAGFDPAIIEVEPSISQSLDLALRDIPGRLFALPTYTALLELRRLLSERGLARDYWR